MAKRDIFRELGEGVSAMKGHREGKLTLHSYKVKPAPLPEVDSSRIRKARPHPEKMASVRSLRAF